LAQESVAYFSIIYLLLIFDQNATPENFSGSYSVEFTTGINLLKSDTIGLSLEITPFIHTENGSSRVSNVRLYHLCTGCF